jgi:hypothetical protein
MKIVVTAAALALALAVAGTCPALAQATDQKPCAPAGDPSQNLSQKLDAGGGVICAPDVDPAIKAPTPDAGKTPVIPPPGSPGGDPKVQPK